MAWIYAFGCFKFFLFYTHPQPIIRRTPKFVNYVYEAPTLTNLKAPPFNLNFVISTPAPPSGFLEPHLRSTHLLKF